MILEMRSGLKVELSDLEKRAWIYVDQEKYAQLADDVKFQVTMLLYSFSQKWTFLATPNEMKFLLQNNVLNSDLTSDFNELLNDPRTISCKKQVLIELTDEIC